MTALKILIFSDSHRSLSGMYRAIDAHRPDQVIHLGDLQRDAEEVAQFYPRIPFCTVPGNCDGWTTDPVKKEIVIGGKRFLLSHGHTWRVKSGHEAAVAEARARGADVLLFGHTHRAYCQRLPDGLWVLNPGASRTSYGLIEPEGGDVRCSILPQE